MTETEVRQCLAAVYEFYRQQLKTSNPDELVKLWHRYLKDEPAELVQAAFDKHIATEEWAPLPAQVLKLVENAKSDMYSNQLAYDPFDRPKKELPREYWPRSVTRRPKQFEIENEQRIMAKLPGADIGLIEE